MMNLNLIFPEIFLSLAIMFLLMVGVFKQNSARIIYNLSSITICLILIIQIIYNILLKYYFNIFCGFFTVPVLKAVGQKINLNI